MRYWHSLFLQVRYSSMDNAVQTPVGVLLAPVHGIYTGSLTARTIEALRAADAAAFPSGTPLDVLVREFRALTGTPQPALQTAPEEPCVSE
jgi:hypothetical protein